MRQATLALLLALPMTLLACGDKGGSDSGASPDGGASDGGASDGGTPDGGASDGGATDGGAGDGGASDGGASDGGAPDGGAGDGGAPDGGAGDGGAPDGGAGDGGFGGGDGGFGDGGAGDGGFGGGDGGFGDGGAGDGGFGGGDGGFGDGGAGDGGFGGGDGGFGDGGAGDGGSTVTLTPTGMYLIWEDSIIDQAHDTVTSSGVDLGSFWGILLVNDDFSFDYTMTDDYCLFKYDTGGASESTDCTSCWEGMAWELTTDDKPETQGNCEGLDADTWGADPTAYFDGVDVIYGYGPDEAGLVDDLLVKYGWADAGWDDTMLWGTYVWSEALGLTDGVIDANQWGVSYALAVDSSGELTGDVATMSGTTPPDGYYATIGFFYFPIE